MAIAITLVPELHIKLLRPVPFAHLCLVWGRRKRMMPQNGDVFAFFFFFEKFVPNPAVDVFGRNFSVCRRIGTGRAELKSEVRNQ